MCWCKTFVSPLHEELYQEWKQHFLALSHQFAINNGNPLHFHQNFIQVCPLGSLGSVIIISPGIGLVPLLWGYNEHDGVSNHQPYDCLLNCLFRRISKKTSKLRVTGLCAGNSPVNSPHKGPVMRKCFHLMTSSCHRKWWWRSFTPNGITNVQWVNSSPPGAPYIDQWIGSALVQIMAYRLSKPVLVYCQLDCKEQTSVKF